MQDVDALAIALRRNIGAGKPPDLLSDARAGAELHLVPFGRRVRNSWEPFRFYVLFAYGYSRMTCIISSIVDA